MNTSQVKKVTMAIARMPLLFFNLVMTMSICWSQWFNKMYTREVLYGTIFETRNTNRE